MDGKRTKTILFSWVPSGVSVKERMLFASSKVDEIFDFSTKHNC